MWLWFNFKEGSLTSAKTIIWWRYELLIRYEIDLWNVWTYSDSKTTGNVPFDCGGMIIPNGLVWLNSMQSIFKDYIKK